MSNMNCQDEHTVLRVLDKYIARDNFALKQYRLNKLQQRNVVFYQRQSDYLNNLKVSIMANTIKMFEAQVIELKEQVNGRYLHFFNMDNGVEGFVPEWCIINHVILPDELLDSEGHVKKGAVLQLREVEGGKIYPGFNYERRATPLTKPVTSTKKMSRESLYEDAQLYQVFSLDSLWNKFAQECQMGHLGADVVLKAMELKAKSSESVQYSSLCAILGIDSADMIGKQENRFREYKSSFLHCANPLHNERTYQYQQIFREIAAFGNGHVAGDVFIGINNKGEVRGIEEELLNETPFTNRADFQADFRNQLNQAIGNYQFVSSITMTWYKTAEEKLFCRISVPKWEGTVILLNGCELYVREDAGKKQLKDKDLIDYIVMNCVVKAA